MGFFDSLSVFKQGATGLLSYAWVLWIFVPIALLIFIGFLWKMIKEKKGQWTHTLRIKRVMQGGLLTKEDIIKMRRFPLIKRAEVFELEKPLLGGYLMPELEAYSGTNEFSIIIDTNNRIYINKGEVFVPEKNCVNVSAKHAEIDIARANLRANYQNINKTSKRVEWSQIAKFAMTGLLIIAVMVIAIKGIGQWGENNKRDAEKAIAEAQTMQSLADAMKTMEGTMNTQVLILELLKQGYGTSNLQPIIRSVTNGTG